MSEDTQVRKDKFYAILDTYIEESVDGVVVNKLQSPPFRHGLTVVKQPLEQLNGVIIHQEKSEVLWPDASGIYSVLGLNDFHDRIVTAMTVYMRKHPQIIGPFETVAQAMVAKEKYRPKTATEKLAAENEELRQKVEKLEKKNEK